jgi:hypothetical protein
MKTHVRVDFPRVKQAHTQEVSRWHASASPWQTTMAARSMAIRSGLYDVSGGAKRLVDIEAAVESSQQAALPELAAELLTLAQHQFVAEVNETRTCSQNAPFPISDNRALSETPPAQRG